MTPQDEEKVSEESQNPEVELKGWSRRKKIVVGGSVVAGILLIALTITLIVVFIERDQYSSEFMFEYGISGTN